MTLLYFVLILGVTVFIHELGHFIFAKKAGVYVYEFALGMGPRLFKFNRKPKKKKINGKIVEVQDETTYSIRLLPIGGYVQMAGEEIELDEKIPVEKRLQTKKWHQRFMVMVAGVMNNFIFAFILLLIIGLSSTISTNATLLTDVNKNLYPTIEEGDRIISVEKAKVRNYDRLNLEMAVYADKGFTMKVRHKDNTTEDIKVKPVAIGKDYLVKDYDFGFEAELKANEDIIDVYVSNSRIDDLKDGVKIVAINGIYFKGYSEFINLLNENKSSFELYYEEENIEKIIKIDSKEVKDESLIAYDMGFDLTGTPKKGILVGIEYAFKKWLSIVEQMFFTVLYLITGKLKLNALSGPVGIYNLVGQVSKAGILSVLSLIALLNINVGFINILPLPAFDGGHALFLIIEKIIGKPVSQKVENTIHTIGMVLLMILMVFITFNDILRIFK